MIPETPTVLVIDDSAEIRRLLKTTLTASKFQVVQAETGTAALALLADRDIDLIILDLGLPDRGGLSLLREIRTLSYVPTIVLSVEDNDASKIAALNIGADDYVTKPFSVEELIARMRVALRHRLQPTDSASALKFGAIEVDLANRRVMRAGLTVRLSPTEFQILRLLAEHAGRTLTHDYLIERVWGPTKSNAIQYLRVYVRSLRQKLGDPAGGERLILTESGVGYRLKLD